MSQETTINNKSIENTDDLRRALAEELKKISGGQSSAPAANAFANLAGKIISSVKLELEYNKIIGTLPNISFVKSEVKQLKPIEIEMNKNEENKL